MLSTLRSSGNMSFEQSNGARRPRVTDLKEHPAYFGKISRANAETYLKSFGDEEGFYIVREGNDGYRISVLHYNDDFDLVVAHYKILFDNTDQTYHFDSTEGEKFTSVSSLIRYFSDEDNEIGIVCELKTPCPRPLQLPRGLEYIRKNDVKLVSEISKGEFGQVWKGKMLDVDVAVKTFGEKENLAATHDLLEATALHETRHSNIIPILGVVGVRPLRLVIKFCPHRDLLSYLLMCGSYEVPFFSRVCMVSQIASALGFMAEKGYVHRNVRASNILVDSQQSCKLSGFGHARKMNASGIYCGVAEDKRFHPTALRWMAIESITSKLFSSASDVWSLASLMIEVFTNGEPPYPGSIVPEIAQKLESGIRPSKPEGVSDALYALMLKCWYPDSRTRPMIDEIQAVLHDFMKPISGKTSKTEKNRPASTSRPSKFWRSTSHRPTVSRFHR